jgi:hypothetical protein
MPEESGVLLLKIKINNSFLMIKRADFLSSSLGENARQCLFIRHREGEPTKFDGNLIRCKC